MENWEVDATAQLMYELLLCVEQKSRDTADAIRVAMHVDYAYAMRIDELVEQLRAGDENLWALLLWHLIRQRFITSRTDEVIDLYVRFKAVSPFAGIGDGPIIVEVLI